MPLSAYRVEPFTHDGITHDVYHRGNGPCVLVAPEIPGITPTVAAFADEVAAAGMSVAIASLFGTPGAPGSTGRALRVIARACVSREFHVLATRDSSPATDWLRALARELHIEYGGPGVGFVGMCFTGGFGLAMMLDEAVIAPVLSQPSLPFGFGAARRRSTGLDADELAAVAEKVEAGCPVLGFRYDQDPLVPAERFEALRAALGSNFMGEDIPAESKRQHSVLTEHLVPGALASTLEFLRDRLGVAAEGVEG